MMTTTPRRPEAGFALKEASLMTNATKTNSGQFHRMVDPASGAFRRMIEPDGPEPAAAASPPRRSAAPKEASPPAQKPSMDFSHLRAAADKWPTQAFAAAADAAKAAPRAEATATRGFVGRLMAADKKRRGEDGGEAPAPGSLAARLLEADARRRGEI